jgi:tRNA(Ile2) C34 agmatinyltransferase TiaS
LKINHFPSKDATAMTLYISLDDTDTRESRGTGRLAREIASELTRSGISVRGVSRHQLLLHPDIPFTSHNSCAVIHVENGKDPGHLFELVRDIMLDDFVEGSDPGLAIARAGDVFPEIMEFGLRAKRDVLTQEMAHDLSRFTDVLLEGLGGTNGGIIGALAGLGLAATGNDGRYVQYRNLRELSGDIMAKDLLASGISRICTLSGEDITAGIIRVRKFPKPAIRCGRPVLYVEEREGIFCEFIFD